MCAQNTQTETTSMHRYTDGRTERQTEISCLHFFRRRRNLLFETVWFARHRNVFKLQILSGSETDSANAFWPLCCRAPNRESLSILSFIHIETIVCLLLFLLLIFLSSVCLPALSSSKSFNIELRFAVYLETIFVIRFFRWFLRCPLFCVCARRARYATILHCTDNHLDALQSNEKKWRHRKYLDAIGNCFESIAQLAAMTTRPIMCASHFSLLLQLKTHDESEWDGMPMPRSVPVWVCRACKTKHADFKMRTDKNSVQLRCRFSFFFLFCCSWWFRCFVFGCRFRDSICKWMRKTK